MKWECVEKPLGKPICKICNGVDLSITKGKDGEAFLFVCKHSEWICVASEDGISLPPFMRKQNEVD